MMLNCIQSRLPVAASCCCAWLGDASLRAAMNTMAFAEGPSSSASQITQPSRGCMPSSPAQASLGWLPRSNPFQQQQQQQQHFRHHNAHAQTSEPPSTSSDQTQKPKAGSLDPKEAAKFAALSAEWWDPAGPFGPLHRFNPARCKFIREAVCSQRGIAKDHLRPLEGLRALDVGCGGGILSESLARMGAQVHAIDVTEENVHVARQHTQLDPTLAKRIKYECVAAEDVLARGDRFDLVVVSEVLEHVRRPDQFMKVMAGLMADAPVPGQQSPAQGPSTGGTGVASTQGDGAVDSVSGAGSDSSAGSRRDARLPSVLIASTLNRTLESFAVAIVGAEYISGAVPMGTHDWTRFITPMELTLMAEQAGLKVNMAAGIGWSLGGLMQLTERTGVNYIASFTRG